MDTLVITITIKVPKSFQGTEHWNRDVCVYDYVRHWLEEGYYVSDYSVELPAGIRYEGFELEWEED